MILQFWYYQGKKLTIKLVCIQFSNLSHMIIEKPHVLFFETEKRVRVRGGAQPSRVSGN